MVGEDQKRSRKQLKLRGAIEEIANDLAAYPDSKLTGGTLHWSPLKPLLIASTAADSQQTDFLFDQYPPS